MHRKRNRRYFVENITSIELAAIICMNINRYFYGSTSSNTLFYLFYFAYILTSFFLYKRGKLLTARKDSEKGFFYGATIYYVAYSLLSSIRLGASALEMTIKLIASILVAWSASKMPIKQIRNSLFIILLYNLIYSIHIYFFPQRAIRQMSIGENNYLSITFTLGLSLALCLCGIVLSLYRNEKRTKGLLFAILAAFFLIIMTKFNSRGSILIPIVSCIVVVIIIAPQRPKKLIISVFGVFLCGYIGIQIYRSHIGDYAYSRMLRLFSNTSSELRVGLWGNYLGEVIARKWYIIGGGANASRIVLGYYPHNLYLQLLGEYGIIGLIIGIAMTVIVVRDIILICYFYRNSTAIDRNNRQTEENAFFFVVTGFIYYFLSFMKSYSFYDSYPLLIFSSLIIHILRVIKRSVVEKNQFSSLSERIDMRVRQY